MYVPLEAKNCFDFPEEQHQTEIFTYAMATVASHNHKVLQNTEKTAARYMLIWG